MKLTLLTPTFKLILYIYIQLTLEEHGFELHWSTYTWIFFNTCSQPSLLEVVGPDDTERQL